MKNTEWYAYEWYVYGIASTLFKIWIWMVYVWNCIRFIQHMDTWHFIIQLEWYGYEEDGIICIWRIYVWHCINIIQSFKCCSAFIHIVTWLAGIWYDSLMCERTHSYAMWLVDMWHDSLMCDMTRWYVTWLIHMRCDSLICDMTR